MWGCRPQTLFNESLITFQKLTLYTFIFCCSEVRLNEALENACSNVLDYKVHKDKVKALRYEKSE